MPRVSQLLEKEKALKAEIDKRETIRALKKYSVSQKKARERIEKDLQNRSDEIINLRESRNREIHDL